MLYSVLFTIPDATTTLTEIGAWSEPIFEEFKDLLWPFIGVAIVILVFSSVFSILRHR